jgi:glycosyltransferase involved in cell wall biosynthesis
VKTIVSITPIAVERDSRTFKIAASMTRLGHRSIVVEAEPSLALGGDLPFELLTIGGRPATSSQVGHYAASADPVTAPHERASFGGNTADGRALPVRLMDGLAPRAPAWLQRVAGPPWRTMLASLRRLMPLALWHYLSSYASSCKAMAAALPAADLYYMHSQQYFPSVWWRSRLGRTPFVYDAHDLYWLMRADGRPPLPLADRAISWVWDLVERACANRARACVTVSDGVAQHADARFRRRFAVVRNAHDSRLDTNGVTRLRERLDLDGDAFVLAVSGNYKRGMAVRQMLHAASMLPEHVHVVFVGLRYEPFATLSGQLGVADRVHFMPPVLPTEIVPLLADADLAAVPYYPSSITVRHALPNGFFHAVAAGVPVLHPRDLVDLRELARRHELGWEMDPQSVRSIVTTVQHVLRSSEELARQRAHLRDVRADLSWANEEEKLGRVVLAALNGRTRV